MRRGTFARRQDDPTRALPTWIGGRCLNFALGLRTVKGGAVPVNNVYDSVFIRKNCGSDAGHVRPPSTAVLPDRHRPRGRIVLRPGGHGSRRAGHRTPTGARIRLRTTRKRRAASHMTDHLLAIVQLGALTTTTDTYMVPVQPRSANRRRGPMRRDAAGVL